MEFDGGGFQKRPAPTQSCSANDDDDDDNGYDDDIQEIILWAFTSLQCLWLRKSEATICSRMSSECCV